MPTTFRTRIATVAVAATALVVLAVPGVAGAHTGADPDGGAFHHRHHRHHHALTDAQKSCLAGQGFTLPLTRDAVHDPATWMRFVAALQTCGILPTRPAPVAAAPTTAPPVQPQVAATPHPSWPVRPDAARWSAPSRSWGNGFDHQSGFDHDGVDRSNGWHGGSGSGWGHGRGGFGH